MHNEHNDIHAIAYTNTFDLDISHDDDLLEEIYGTITNGTLAAFEDMDELSIEQLNKHSAMGLYTEWTATQLDVHDMYTKISGYGTHFDKVHRSLHFTYTAEINTARRRYYINCDMDDVIVSVQIT